MRFAEEAVIIMSNHLTEGVPNVYGDGLVVSIEENSIQGCLFWKFYAAKSTK